MFYKIVLAALVLLSVYVGVSFFSLRSQLFQVYDVPAGYFSGPADADLTVVEFVLYSCQTCQKIQEPLGKAMARDGRVRYVPRPVAFEKDNPGQEALVKLTYAAAKQGKFMQTFHYLLGRSSVTLDDVQLARISADLELDILQLKNDMKSPDVEKAVKENDRYFEDWGLNSVPVFLMGTSAIYRVRSSDNIPTEDELIEMFEKARSFF